jgi:hypothetical protein
VRQANTPGDRRNHVGVAQVDLGGIDGGSARRDVSRSLSLACHRVVVVLLADRVGRNQHLVARDQCVLRGDVRLRLRYRCFRGIQRGDIRRRVDLVQPLTGLDVRAFDEFTPQHDAVDPCAHLRDEERTRTAGQFGRDGNGGGLDGDDADFGRLWRWC